MKTKVNSKAIMIDAMFTIFVPKMGRWGLYQLLIKRFTGMDVREDLIQIIYKEKREKAEKAEVRPDGPLPRGYYRRFWSGINAAILREINPCIDEDVLSRVSERIFLEVMGSPEFFIVRDDVRMFLEIAAEKSYSLYVVSNQEPEALNRLLRAFGISHFFKGVVVSDEVGYQKPDSRFFVEAIKRARLLVGKIAFLGNNPKNDMEGAANGGISRRFLFDPDGEHLGTKTSIGFVRLSRLTDVFGYF